MKQTEPNSLNFCRALCASIALLVLAGPLSAQNNAQEAAALLQQLDVQIMQAARNGDRERMHFLQNRSMEIQKKWDVQPANGSIPPQPVPKQRPTVVVPQQPVIPHPHLMPRGPQAVETQKPQVGQQPLQPVRQASQPIGDAEDMKQREAKAVALTNEERQKQGLSPLRVDDKLTAAARDHSNDMLRKNFFSHTSPVPGKARFFHRAHNFGTTANGENIARNSGSPSDVMNRWMNSEGHRRNILTPGYKRIGIGKAGPYWTMLLGK